MKHYYATDHEALAVLIRFAEMEGARVTHVRPFNDGFAVRLTCGPEFEISNQTNLRGCLKDVDPRRTYWESCVEVHADSIKFFEVFADAIPAG